MTIDKKNIGKWALILTPILIGVYIIYNKLKNNEKPVYNNPAPKANPIAPTTTSSSDSYFPLKVGSNNDYVKQLQDELGIAIDGIFGNQTLAALKQQANKSMITNYADLQSTLALIDNNDNAAANIAAKTNDAQIFIQAYNANPIGDNLVPSKDIRLTQLSDLAPYIYSNKYMNWQSGITYMATQWQPIDITSQGDLVLNNTIDNSKWAIDSTLLNQ